MSLGSKAPSDWQDHYGAFSLSRSHVPRVTRYVEGQKIHHAANNLWDEWEQTEAERDEDDVL